MFARATDVSISARAAPVTTAIKRKSVDVACEGAAAQQLAAVGMLGRQLGCELGDERLDLVVDLIAPGVTGPALELHIDAGELLVEGKAEQRRQTVEQFPRAACYEGFGVLAAGPVPVARFRFQCLGHAPK